MNGETKRQHNDVRRLFDLAFAAPASERGPPLESGWGEPIGDMADIASRDSERIVRCDEAFRRLDSETPDGTVVARLRFYVGLSVEQTAAALGLSTSTVDRR